MVRDTPLEPVRAVSEGSPAADERWLIVGHFGARNTGDDAMLAALLGHVSRSSFPGRRFVIACKNGVVPGHLRSPNVRAVRLGLVELLPELASCTGVILGGGTNFHDGHEGRRYRRHLIAMTRIAGVLLIARLLRRRVLAVSAGVGPITRWPTRLLARLAVRSCHRQVVRDRASITTLEALTTSRNWSYAFDAAMLVAGGVPDRAPEGKIIGLSPRALPGASDEYEGWAGIVQALSAQMAADPALRVRLIPFSDGRESDCGLTARLADWMEARHPGRVDRFSYDENPLQVLDRIRACTHYVAGRYHAALLGYLAGCRLWMVPYHRKLEDLAGEIGLDAAAVLSELHRTPQHELDRRAAELVAGHPAFVPTRSREDALQSARGNLIIPGSDVLCAAF